MFVNTDTQTIFALSSGYGTCGVAVIRISGTKAKACLAELLAGELPRERVIKTAILYDPVSKLPLDKAMVFWLKGPKSSTGEDMAELHVHGSSAVIRSIMSCLGAMEGCRLSEAGEFTKRSFLNGKLDLVEVEGLGDLLSAKTKAQLRQAWFHKSGEASEVYGEWRTKILSTCAYFEAILDFSEDNDFDIHNHTRLLAPIKEVLGEINNALRDGERGEKIREGVQVVLSGAPNVGKSSLLNALAGRNAAIVSHEAGTTRDVIEVQMELDGIPVILRDTAGLRHGEVGDIEKEGIHRAQQQILDADILLEISAPDVNSIYKKTPTKAQILKLYNKIDIARDIVKPKGYDAYISVETGEGIKILLDKILSLIQEKINWQQPALITRERHRQCLSSCAEHLEATLDISGASEELIAETLRLALRELGRLTGAVDVEELLDVIFRDFCIGK